MAALSVVVPIICGRSFSGEELAYIRVRVERVQKDVLAESLEWLGDHADRVGNPIARILDRASEVVKDRIGRAEAESAAADMERVTPQQRERNREALTTIQRTIGRARHGL